MRRRRYSTHGIVDEGVYVSTANSNYPLLLVHLSNYLFFSVSCVENSTGALCPNAENACRRQSVRNTGSKVDIINVDTWYTKLSVIYGNNGGGDRIHMSGPLTVGSLFPEFQMAGIDTLCLLVDFCLNVLLRIPTGGVT